MGKTLVEQFVEDPQNLRLFQQERAVYEVTALIESVMVAEGINRSELARRLGKSKGWVARLLDGGGDKSIRNLADALAVLGWELQCVARIQSRRELRQAPA